MNTYAFLTEHNFRIETKGTKPETALKTLLKVNGYAYELNGQRVTAMFIKYDNKGIADYNFKSTPETENIINQTFNTTN